MENDFQDPEEISVSDLITLDLTSLDENVELQVEGDNFPLCYISRSGNKLIVQIGEHIYTKYWFHKYHASVFSEAMIRAIKLLRLEGVPFFNEEIESDDEVHIFVRWELVEPASIENKILIENIRIAWNSVFERANSMLENSDSVLILGKDTGESFELLKRIQNYLENLGFYTYIIKEQPDVIGESVMQKVLRYGLSSRFVIIENTEPSGHLYELPQITKLAELTTIILQEKGEGSTWMFEDLYPRLCSIKKFEYTAETLEEKIGDGILWANQYLQDFKKFQKDTLPWLKKVSKNG